MSESSLTRACFAALMCANSTCRLWDKALDASECNFLPYLLGKYFDVGGGEENTQSFCSRTFHLCAGGDFTTLTCRLSDFHQPHL